MHQDFSKSHSQIFKNKFISNAQNENHTTGFDQCPCEMKNDAAGCIRRVQPKKACNNPNHG